MCQPQRALLYTQHTTEHPVKKLAHTRPGLKHRLQKNNYTPNDLHEPVLPRGLRNPPFTVLDTYTKSFSHFYYIAIAFNADQPICSAIAYLGIAPFSPVVLVHAKCTSAIDSI